MAQAQKKTTHTEKAREHYFSETQTSQLREKDFVCILRGQRFTFCSAQGTFAKYRVDDGTRLLVESVEVPDGKKGTTILDLGCGVGIVGISLARCLHVHAVLTDINERAVALAERNAALNGVRNLVGVRQGDLYAVLAKDERFDAILANPPMAAGRELCYRMIDEASSHLNEGGTLQLVSRHNKGGAMLEKRMREAFGNCRATAKKRGFRVYVSERQ